MYIESDDDDKMDDISSISSSEDIEILSSLSHWGARDIMHADVPSVKSMHDDYASLSMTYLDEICYSDEETKESEEEEEEEVIAFDDSDLDLELIENVPDSLKHSYRAMMREEKMLFETQTKRYHKLNKKRTTVEKKKFPKNRDKSIIDK